MVRANIDESPPAVAARAAGPDGQPDGDGGAVPVEERSALFDALQSLPEKQRKVVVLRHWLGLSVRETATELGINEGTVKSHSSRGLARPARRRSRSRGRTRRRGRGTSRAPATRYGNSSRRQA